ncbi:conjugative transfer signal peptidase TraF [Deltaproteobacteria bacterium OttesenSCG-928-M10]|nr:conjugative transfer signal peptidase TraF [Deltaproteobacteria bacterium OttesenSCG-928-M10]
MKTTKHSWKRETFMLILDVVVILLIAAWILGFRVNTTPSLPEGIYQISSSDFGRGDLVGFCLDSENPFSPLAEEREYLGSGSCPSGLRPLIKHLIGLPGDDLRITDEGLTLNGSLLPATILADRDSQGRPMPPSLLNEGIIPDGLCLVLSQQHIGSFDSRYFGLVPLESLRKVIPIAVFGQG